MKKHILLLEDITLLVTQIECMLNSRPITAMSTDANDLTGLTPGHFLIGSPTNLMPDITSSPSRSLSLKDFQRLQQMNSFWIEWHRSFIISLQVRKKLTNDNETNLMLAIWY